MSEQHSIKHRLPSIDIDNGDPSQLPSASPDSDNGKIRRPLLSFSSDISNQHSPRERTVFTHAQTPPYRSAHTFKQFFRRAASFPPHRNPSSAPAVATSASEMMGRGGHADEVSPADGGGAPACAGMRRRHPAHAYEADVAAGSPPAAYPP
eukprot:CAMPEP_0194283428 /NCGR_PEP_ID=MMETSP0169-20130528/25328_1 /TAXON_ID=218684 /ORGANISM="Corethron pennatum, Strain L29A3" /LENGTH=150 /DNA_ID=CAMNT_0039029025 /DNA_START=72 /DNA_END=520 /DNA_ORIENTATION=+